MYCPCHLWKCHPIGNDAICVASPWAVKAERGDLIAELNHGRFCQKTLPM